MIGMSRPYLDRIESGRANITVRELERLAGGLDLKPYQLLKD